MIINPAIAQSLLYADAEHVIHNINAFTSQAFRTRGGRLGSGMGSLIEALWVYHMNTVLQNEGGAAQHCEIAWLQDHEPADFACLVRGADWEPSSRQGELFRIEAKSMNTGVDEAKGHFTNLRNETSEYDQLLVVVWSWETTANQYFWPRIHDYFLDRALPIIELRDALHLQRNGTFVNSYNCPDGCTPSACTHTEEPLNSAGKRERRSGPKKCKPANVDYAANFGGLIRMLKTNNDLARQCFRTFRRTSPIAHRYISFIHKHYPSEEINQYKLAEWQALLRHVGLRANDVSSHEANATLRQHIPNYQDLLRDLF